MGCQWGDVLGLHLLPVVPQDVETYLTELMQSTFLLRFPKNVKTKSLDVGEGYTYQYGFRTLTSHVPDLSKHVPNGPGPRLVVRIWSDCWDRAVVRD